MGNAAHDLKTPLHSIEADLEMLSLLISKIPLSIIEKAIASMQSPCNKQAFDPQVIFSAMSATCKFMEMSINRSQDFMKVSLYLPFYYVFNSFNTYMFLKLV
jgi:signal transduction histidine kinase